MIYNYYTKNQSFLDVHKSLLDQSIKNNSFMLQLNNPELLNIDPFDPNISNEDKCVIAKECVENFWYFIREVIKWPMGDGSFVHTKLDRGNAAMYWNTLHSISSWRTNIRQTCSDLSVNSIMLWNLISKSVSANIISKETSCSIDNLVKILELAKSASIDLSEIIEPIYGDIKCTSVRLLRNRLLPSDLNIIVNTKDKYQTELLFRGNHDDVTFFHMAEFIPNLETMVNIRNVVLSLTDTRRINIFNSSYGKSDSPSTIFSQKYIEGMINWSDYFYDYDVARYALDLIKYGNGVVYIKHDYKELGYDQTWFNKLSKVMGKVNIDKEILLRRS